MFAGATVVVSAARITHTLHHCHLSYQLILKNLIEKDRETERENENKTEGQKEKT